MNVLVWINLIENGSVDYTTLTRLAHGHEGFNSAEKIDSFMFNLRDHSAIANNLFKKEYGRNLHYLNLSLNSHLKVVLKWNKRFNILGKNAENNKKLIPKILNLTLDMVCDNELDAAFSKMKRHLEQGDIIYYAYEFHDMRFIE